MGQRAEGRGEREFKVYGLKFKVGLHGAKRVQGFAEGIPSEKVQRFSNYLSAKIREAASEVFLPSFHSGIKTPSQTRTTNVVCFGRSSLAKSYYKVCFVQEYS